MMSCYYLHQASIFIAKDLFGPTVHLRDYQLQLWQMQVLQTDQTQSICDLVHKHACGEADIKADIEYILKQTLNTYLYIVLSRHLSKLDVLILLKELNSPFFKLGSNSSLSQHEFL